MRAATMRRPACSKRLIDVADQVLLHAVGLDNGKSAFERHESSILESESDMNQ